MSISLGIIFGIIAMIGWGVADFFVAKAVRKTTVLKAFVWSQMISAILLFLIFLSFFKFQYFSLATFGLVLITGFLGAVSYLAFFKGLQIGKVSIVSPVTSCWAVITVILSLVFLNEKLTSIQGIGVALAILGAVLTSFKYHDLVKLKFKDVSRGVGYAVLAAIAWGLYFYFIDILVSKMDWFLPILFIKTFAVLWVLGYSGLAKKKISFPKNIILFIFLMGVLEVIAFLAYGAGITFQYTAIIASISAAFPMVTVILARIFLKETLELNQKIGVVSVLIGLVLLSI